MILPHSHAPGLEDLPIVPPVLGEYDGGMKAFPAVKPEGRRILARKVDLKMGEKIFLAYKPNGEEIHSVQEFVDFYRDKYYEMIDDFDEEEKIKDILKKDRLTVADICDILCWKIPAIINPDKKHVTHSIYASRVIPCESICKFLPDRPVSSEDDARELVKKVNSLKYMGPVYALTILYFASKGKYPIYDQFAHIALMKIKDGSDFDSVINKKNRIDPEFDTSKCIDKIFYQYNKNYVSRIRDIFGDAYTKSRDIDQALWAYGHFFKENNRYCKAAHKK